jgi:glycosyltransferase involved in cell wall biosynthesis
VKLALVLWNGNIGGAESITAALAREWRAAGVDASVVFIQHAEPLAERLRAGGVPHHALELDRGSKVILHPRRFAAAVGAAGPDGALVADCGHPAAVLRAGGYRAPIVGVEHGPLLLLPSMPPAKRLFHAAGRAAGARARDADVAVSDFMLGAHREHAHARRSLRVHNFVDPSAFDDPRPRTPGEELVVGCAARLIPGKGIDHAVEAIAAVRERRPARLVVAGDGPERERLAARAHELGVADAVELRGFVRDMRGFFDGCDVVVVPSDTFVESFCLVALEAMARGRPVVGTLNGGVPEVVADGQTGTLVPPGRPDRLAAALLAYGADPTLAAEHGRRGRVRAREEFDPARLAADYLAVFRSLRTGVASTAAAPPSRKK